MDPDEPPLEVVRQPLIMTMEELTALDEKAGLRKVVELTWEQGADHREFVKSSQDKYREASMRRIVMFLYLGENFIKSFCELEDDDAANHVLDTLATLPISNTTYGNDRRPLPEQIAPGGPFASRFDQLCRALADFSELKAATVQLQPDTGDEARKIVAAATRLIDLELVVVHATGPNDVEQVMTGLAGHSSIQSFAVVSQTGLYPTILPTLQSLPSLKTVKLTSGSARICQWLDSGGPINHSVYSQLVFIGAMELDGLDEAIANANAAAPAPDQDEPNARLEGGDEVNGLDGDDDVDEQADTVSNQDEEDGSSLHASRDEDAEAVQIVDIISSDALLVDAPLSADNATSVASANAPATAPEQRTMNDIRALSLASCQALNDLLQMTSLGKVFLYGLDFSTKAAHDQLCRMILEALVPDLSLERCRFLNAGDVAAALAAMQHVKFLRLAKLMFVDKSLTLFLKTLASGMTGTSGLEGLVYDPWRTEVDHTDEEEGALDELARAAGEMPRLKHLEIHVQAFLPRTDEALASCVRENDQLEEITVYWPALSKSDPVYVTPALCDAMGTNYTMKRINFKHTDTYFDTRDFWDSSDKKKVATMLRLNECGRAYMASNPTSQYSGVGVLEQVNDDMDCLFVHLRENPLLCKFKTEAAFEVTPEETTRKFWIKICASFLGIMLLASMAFVVK